MKDFSSLKWAHNNYKNNNKGKTKEEKNKNWIHPADSLISGHVVYLVKFLGSTEVDQPKGIEVVKEGIRKLKFASQQIKKEGTKIPKVELTVSVDGVAIQDPKSKAVRNQYPLHRISYCADDKAEKRFFSFIAKEDDDKHTCFVFVSDKLAEEITLTIGQAFDLAYKRYLSGSQGSRGESATQDTESKVLKERLQEMSSLLSPTQLNNFLDKHNITDVCEIKGETDNQSNNGNIKAMSLDSSQASVDQSADDQLINLDVPVSKFDNMTLDDLNDDDFDPRAGNQTGDSDSSDDFNPRSAPVIQQSPAIPPPGQSILLSPPVLPPRDPGNAKPVSTNPFNSPAAFNSPAGFPQDPFGMPTFNTPEKKAAQALGFGAPIQDVFADLDPLKK